MQSLRLTGTLHTLIKPFIRIYYNYRAKLLFLVENISKNFYLRKVPDRGDFFRRTHLFWRFRPLSHWNTGTPSEYSSDNTAKSVPKRNQAK